MSAHHCSVNCLVDGQNDYEAVEVNITFLFDYFSPFSLSSRRGCVTCLTPEGAATHSGLNQLTGVL